MNKLSSCFSSFFKFKIALVCLFFKSVSALQLGQFIQLYYLQQYRYVHVIRLFAAIKESENCEKHQVLEKYSLMMVVMMSVFQIFFVYTLTQAIFKMTQLKMTCGTYDPL